MSKNKHGEEALELRGADALEPEVELGPVMDLPSFEAAAEAYGGDLAFWPSARRTEAEALLAQGGEIASAAREILEREADFDAQLSQAAFIDASLSGAQMGRFLAGAEQASASPLQRFWAQAMALLGGVADQVGEQISPDRGLRLSSGDLRWNALGGLGGLAAAAGLAFGLWGPVATTTQVAVASATDSAVYDPLGYEEDIEFFVSDLDDELDAGLEADG